MATDPAPSDDRVRILVVEDDAAARVGFQQLLRSWGYAVEAAADGEDALAEGPRLPPGHRPQRSRDAEARRPRPARAPCSRRAPASPPSSSPRRARSTPPSRRSSRARTTTSRKPVDFQRLRILLDKIIERQATLREVKALRRQLREHGSFGSMIGGSAPMREVYRLIEQAAPTSASVLITGESGTGKELVAQTIHRLSPRASAPWVPHQLRRDSRDAARVASCSATSGARSPGAIERQAGCFELAHRGTLFLDEIAEMTPATQVKLLRVLQERSFRRLGGRVEQSVDIRVIAATNADPAAAVQKGTLREDLYYRLNVVGIRLPPLRERKDDLPLLVDTFHPRVQRAEREGRWRASRPPRGACSRTTRGRATSASCAT